MVDDTLKKMGTDTKAFQTYLDVQAKFGRYSVSNALLVAAQKPEATDLGDANFWRGKGGYIRKGESGILLMEPGNAYTRKDGSKGPAACGWPIPPCQKFRSFHRSFPFAIFSTAFSAMVSSVSLIFPRPR